MTDEQVREIQAALDAITAIREQLHATEDDAEIDQLQDELERAYWPLIGNQSEDPTATGSAYGWLRALLQERAALVEWKQSAMIQLLAYSSQVEAAATELGLVKLGEIN